MPKNKYKILLKKCSVPESQQKKSCHLDHELIYKLILHLQIFCVDKRGKKPESG